MARVLGKPPQHIGPFLQELRWVSSSTMALEAAVAVERPPITNAAVLKKCIFFVGNASSRSDSFLTNTPSEKA